MTRASAPAPAPRLRLYLFGKFHLESEAGPIYLPTRKIESLLAYLALHRDEQQRETLAALLWGDSPDVQARNSLRHALATLRKSLGDDLLLADREAVQLNPAFPLWVDALEFQAQATRFLSEPAPDPDSIDVSLYQGDLLAGFYDDWIPAQREYYHGLYVDTLLRLTQNMRSRSEYGRAIKLARQVLATDPGNEKAHQALMFCYTASGDQSAALKQYQECRRSLLEEFAAEPLPETTALYHWIKETAARAKSPEAAPTNLPIPLTSFVGRRREVEEARPLLAAARLLTFTGSGGVGKTRLAIQVAAEAVETFKDGVWWVDLAALRETELVPQVVAKTVGLNEAPGSSLMEALMDWLRPKQTLLVFDNCEHLLTACAQLCTTLLRHCPILRILATSREAFGLTGEIAWPVPNLSVPENGAHASSAQVPSALLQSESVRLFVERAVAVKPGFDLDEQNAPIVAGVCRRLEGIPLAIELAAAQVKTLSLDQIAAGLNDRFSLLQTNGRGVLPRHQTLRAAIDWSYGLLPEAEQGLLRRLSVFAGSFTAEAAEVICADSPARKRRKAKGAPPAAPQPAPSRSPSRFPGSGRSRGGLHAMLIPLHLSRLADKSLLTVEYQGEEARYRFLETIREYAFEKLLESGEADRLRDRHLDFFLRLAEEAAPELAGPGQARWLERLEQEHDNLRAALRWSLDCQATDLGLRLSAGLTRFWRVRGHLSEARGWFEAVLQADEQAANARPAAFDPQRWNVRAKVLNSAGTMAWEQADYAQAEARYQESLNLRLQLEDQWGIAQSLGNLGYIALSRGDPATARAHGGMPGSVQGTGP